MPCRPADVDPRKRAGVRPAGESLRWLIVGGAAAVAAGVDSAAGDVEVEEELAWRTSWLAALALARQPVCPAGATLARAGRPGRLQLSVAETAGICGALGPRRHPPSVPDLAALWRNGKAVR